MATQTDETYEFDSIQSIKGYPTLNWAGKRPFQSTQYYPAQLKETYGEEVDGWTSKIYWGDNLQVMSHLIKTYRGKISLIYIDPPFDSKADYKKRIELMGEKVENDRTAFEEKQYTDIWTNDEYLQFMYERLILMRELLADQGSIYLHCDPNMSHYLKLIMDEVFTIGHFQNEIVWCYGGRGMSKTRFNRKHDIILFYGKTKHRFFSVDGASRPVAQEHVGRYDQTDDQGRRYARIRNSDGSYSNIYLSDVVREDWWEIPYVRGNERTDYPTQKPEALLERIIKASSNPGDLVFDCFMGSGTTQAVAMKLGRRFIGADINLGAVETTTKRLLSVAAEVQNNTEQEKIDNQEGDTEGVETYYTGFEVYNVNHYDVFRNPAQAKDLLIEALEIQPLPANGIYDGERDGRMVKIMPINRIATRVDLDELIFGFDQQTFQERQEKNPTRPVEKLLLVCMGHQPDLAATLQSGVAFDLDIEVMDILRDKSNLEFKRESEAKIVRSNGQLIIEQFYPMNLLQKMGLMKENVEEWQELVESVKIDFNYDGGVMNPSVIDLLEENEQVKGTYPIPEDAGTIRVKITDLLSESLEVTVE